MAQLITLMSAAAGVQAAANHNAGTAVPSQGSVPAITPDRAGEVISVESVIALTQAAHPLAANDIFVAMPLPAGMNLVDAYVIMTDSDTGANLTITLAELLQDFTDIIAGTELIIASTVGQAGGIARAANAPGMLVAVSSADRWFGIKIVGAPAGLQATGTLQVNLTYQSA